MRMWSSVLAIASVLAACGDDDGGEQPMPDAPAQLRYPVSFQVRGDVPLLIAFADDDGTWTKVPPTTEDAMYMIQATNRHAIAIVCGAAGSGYRTEVELRTRFDDAPFLFCFNGSGAPTQQPFVITGEMAQPGTVSMESTDTGTTSPWSYELFVSGGAHDLVAFGDSMALVRRNVMVTANATLPAIDVSQGGAAYSTTPVLLGNALADETVETVASIFTGNDIADYRRAGTTVYELASVLVEPSDFQFAEIRATTATTSRTAPVESGGTAPMITLMPRLSGITFTETGAMWTELPDSTASIRITAAEGMNVSTFEATGGYLAGATEVGVTLDIPDFDDAWRVTGATAKLFSAQDDEFAATTFTNLATAARQVQSEAASRHRLDRVRRVRSVDEAVARARR